MEVEMKESKGGLFHLDAVYLVSGVVFVVVSALMFIEPIRTTYWGGLSATMWMLSVIALCIPIFNIIAAFIKDRH
jgi:hypothetical protein